jgi:DNA-binding transcriptional LysR family regulator
MLQDIELRQLRALEAVAAEGSFGRAADRLGFSQSAVSQQIAALERAVGDKVFDRPGGPRRVELTPIGALLLTHSQSILGVLQAAEDGLRSLRAGEVGRLVVGSFQSVSVNLLPKVIGQLREERPGLAVRCIESDDNDELIARMIADELDLTFLIGAPEYDGIELIEVHVDPFVLLSPASELRSTIPLAELDHAPLVGQADCSCQQSIDAFLRNEDVEPDVVFRSNDNAAVQAMVRAGMGQAILPYLAIDPKDPGISIATLSPALPPRIISLARRKGRTLIPAANRFFELAQSVAADLPSFSTPIEGWSHVDKVDRTVLELR